MAIDIIHGTGYRVGTTARTIGGTTAAPDDFVVLDLTTNNLYVASGGEWTDGGTYPDTAFDADDFELWLLS